ncbi:hypothetical protein JW960_26110 [candidate division KSB1 bacterium]|nr:hypothetical protein [candidate division KSB1 bacterium]
MRNPKPNAFNSFETKARALPDFKGLNAFLFENNTGTYLVWALPEVQPYYYNSGNMSI